MGRLFVLLLFSRTALISAGQTFLLIFFSFAFTAAAFDQRNTGDVFQLNKVPNPDLTEDVTEFSQLQKSWIGWIRLHMVVDSSIVEQQLTASVNQNAASEIYVNEKLIIKHGSINSDRSKTSRWRYEIKVLTQEDGGSVFSIELPFK